ncbi:MAG: extracellular solute-binding protein [Clostridia bacterium]|nr:extracellular solute-binding protein [Clostridia bacterium]
MKRKQAYTLILLAAIASGFTACGGTAPSSDTTAPTDMTTAAPETGLAVNFTPELAEKLGLDGYDFHVFLRAASSAWSNPDIYVEDANGEVFNDAVFKRNQYLSETYGISVSVSYSANTSGTELGTAILAGDDSYDAAFPMARTAAGFAQEGALADFSSLEYVNLNSPVWNKTFNDNLTIGGKLYYATGDVSVNAFQSTRCFLFNKDLIEKYKLESPYALVKSGKWTYDRLAEMSAAASADLNGDSAMYESDQWGFIMQKPTAGLPLFFGSGENTTVMENGLPVISLGKERANNVFERIKDMLSDEKVYYIGEDAVIKQMYADGKGLFYTGVINTTSDLRASDIDFGLIPAPKYDASQEFYRAYADGWCISPAVIPVSAKNVERSGFILQAMAEASAEMVRPAYYDIVLTGKNLRDKESAEMLDLLCANFTLDNCDVYSWSGVMTIISQTLGRQQDQALATILASTESALQAAIDKTVEALK